MQKARCHPDKSRLQLLVSIWFQVLFHSPNRGSFHLSLTVLCAIGYERVFSLSRWASQIHTGFHVTRITWEHIKEVCPFSHTGLSPSMVPLIQRCSANRQICNLPRDPYSPEDMSHYPVRTTDTAYHVRTVWAIPRSLATTSGITICFLFLPLLRCFSSGGSRRLVMPSA